MFFVSMEVDIIHAAAALAATKQGCTRGHGEKEEADEMGDIFCRRTTTGGRSVTRGTICLCLMQPMCLTQVHNFFNKDGYQWRAAEQSHLVNKHRAALSI